MPTLSLTQWINIFYSWLTIPITLTNSCLSSSGSTISKISHISLQIIPLQPEIHTLSNSAHQSSGTNVAQPYLEPNLQLDSAFNPQLDVMALETSNQVDESYSNSTNQSFRTNVTQPHLEPNP